MTFTSFKLTGMPKSNVRVCMRNHVYKHTHFLYQNKLISLTRNYPLNPFKLDYNSVIYFVAACSHVLLRSVSRGSLWGVPMRVGETIPEHQLAHNWNTYASNACGAILRFLKCPHTNKGTSSTSLYIRCVWCGCSSGRWHASAFAGGQFRTELCKATSLSWFFWWFVWFIVFL